MILVNQIAVILGVLVASSSADFLGRLCGTQWGESHSYPSGGSTVRKCIEHCRAGNYSIAGLIFGNECFCQNDFGGYAHCRPGDKRPECNTPECTTDGKPCFHDNTMTCGDTSWYSIYDASADLHNVVTHEDTLVNQICSQNDDECNWYCDITDTLYTYPLGSVFGSVTYDINSSYCLSAAHDLRYIPNKRTGVIVARQNVKEDLEGSWRYGIQSTWTSQSTNAFTVIYPQNRVYQFAGAVLFGFVDQAKRSLNCAKYTYDTNFTSDRVFVGEIGRTTYTVNPVTNVHVPEQFELYCGLNTSDVRFPATYVPVVTQPTGNDKITPNRTVVVKEGDIIQIHYETNGLTGGPWHVEKAGRTVVAQSTASPFLVSRPNATIAMGGFYRLMNNNGQLVATVRVIIIPNGQPAESCGGFRGVKREDGTCLCYPPFGNGADCSGVCNFPKLDGTFGPKCDMNCGAAKCKGIMVCGEDPYGCHCSSGWMGDECSVPCPEGTWGPDCKQHADGCKCIDGEGCGRITGLCPDGCIWGYYELDCKTEGGYLVVAPYIVKEGYTDIKVGWEEWSFVRDNGTLTPDKYYLQYKKCADPDSAYTNITTQDATGADNYTFDVTKLEQDQCYSFRVQTSVRELITPQVSPSVDGHTICGTPDQAPQSLKGTPGDHSIDYSWVWPDSSHWKCDKSAIQCDYNCSYFCGIQTESGSFRENDTTVTTHTVQVPDYSNCSLSCHLINDNMEKGPSADVRDIQPITGTPPAAVQHFNVFLAQEGLVAAWEAGNGDEGHILYYQVAVTPPGTVMNVTKHSYLDSSAVNGKDYTVSVTPVSDEGKGPTMTKTVKYLTPSTVGTQTTVSTTPLAGNATTSTASTHPTTTKGARSSFDNSILKVTVVGMIAGVLCLKNLML